MLTLSFLFLFYVIIIIFLILLQKESIVIKRLSFPKLVANIKNR